MKTRAPDRPIRPGWIFAHILHNTGFADIDELAALVDAWRNLYEYVQPDLVVFDHSPTALLASRGYDLKRVVIGSGFCVPPDQSPMPNLRPWMQADEQKLYAYERLLLERMNRVLAERRMPTVERVTQMYGEVDQTLLVTFRELDHYAERPGGEYLGVWSKSQGRPPEWPKGDGPRIYAYLKPFPALPQLLGMLKELGHPTIVLADGISPALQQRFACDSLRFETRHLHMEAVASQCQLAILNAGHGTTASMLLAGRPVLLLPIYLEQAMLARSVQRMGAGLVGPIKSFKHIAQALQRMLQTDRFAMAAEQFAMKYAEFDPMRMKEELVEHVEGLLSRSNGKPAVRSNGRVASPFAMAAGDWSATPIQPSW